MDAIVVERTAAVPASAAAVHATLTVSAERRRLLPSHCVRALELERGLSGIGTLRLELVAGDAVHELEPSHVEPEFGQVLVEASADGAVRRRYHLESDAGGTVTHVRSRLELRLDARSGDLARVLREVQAAELESLGRGVAP
jgi:hypothetical protein